MNCFSFHVVFVVLGIHGCTDNAVIESISEWASNGVGKSSSAMPALATPQNSFCVFSFINRVHAGYVLLLPFCLEGFRLPSNYFFADFCS
jgi:hypothetical protein